MGSTAKDGNADDEPPAAPQSRDQHVISLHNPHLQRELNKIHLAKSAIDAGVALMQALIEFDQRSRK